MDEKKYLKQLKKGLMTQKEVAEKLNISQKKVRRIYDKYVDFSKKSKLQIVTTIMSIVAIVISCGGLALQYNSNKEMVRERKLAYAPIITVDNNTMTVAWDENGSVNNIIQSKSYTSVPEAQTGQKTNRVYFGFVNIGRGTAQDIEYTWDNMSNICQFMDILDQTIVEQKAEGLYLVHKEDGESYQYGSNDNRDIRGNISYLYPKEEKQVILPYEYISLMAYSCYEQLRYNFDRAEDSYILNNMRFPEISIDIKYQDLQSDSDSPLKERIQLTFEPTYFEIEENHSGYCNLIMKEVMNGKKPKE